MMRIKKTIALLLVLVLSITCTSCTKAAGKQMSAKPEISQMKSICELATMKCYYHNVAKYTEKDAQGALFWKKDMRFWIEYSGTVKIGIDASKVTMEVDEDSVTITIPSAKVLDNEVNPDSLTPESFFIDKDSADVDADAQTKAFAAAQENMVKAASADTALLSSAQQRAQKLLESYVTNIGNAVGKVYTIKWKYIESEEKATEVTDEEPADSVETKEE